MSKRPVDNYQRPEKTYTESLTEDDIKAKLVNYEKIDSTEMLVRGNHIRYYSPSKDDPTKLKFCVGGFVKSKHDEYLVLSQNVFGKGKTWSVQKKGAVFYRKLAPNEILTRRVAELEEENGRLRAENTELKQKMEAAKAKALARSQATRVPPSR